MAGVPSVDVVYVAASANDARFTRSCVASIRSFYPDIPIRLLVGGLLERGLAATMRDYWDTGVADIPEGDYGWGLVKLEPLFGPVGERFLVLDSDTVIAGPVLSLWSADDPPFLVDDEVQSADDTKRLYYDWEKVREIDARAVPPSFVFNSGQWFGTAGILTRDDFAPWVEWSFPRKTRHAECFMPGDQGVLNYVLNRKAERDGLNVKRRKIMRWPEHGMEGLDVGTVAARRAAPLVVHWAGIRKARRRRTTGGDLLDHFERQFYSRLPYGTLRRMAARCWYPTEFWRRQARSRARLGLRTMRRRLEALGSSSH